MKRIWCYMVLACLLAGCGGGQTFEIVADEPVLSQAVPRKIQVALPQETVLPVMESDSGQLYICRDFEVSVQTLPGGDLNATIQTLCGFEAGDVDVVETIRDGLVRYDFVWASAGETGDQVGRSAILNDGAYHYCVTAMAPETVANQYREIWQEMFETITLS